MINSLSSVFLEIQDINVLNVISFSFSFVIPLILNETRRVITKKGELKLSLVPLHVNVSQVRSFVVVAFCNLSGRIGCWSV